MESPDAVKVLALMHKNKLPVFISYDSYSNASNSCFIENCNSIDVAKHHKRDDIIDFYESIKSDDFLKVKEASERYGDHAHDYKVFV